LRQESLDCFLARIRRATDDGQLPADTDAPTMAAAFNTMLDGMSLRARAGANRTSSHPSGVQP
jgi:hypothetical protein